MTIQKQGEHKMGLNQNGLELLSDAAVGGEARVSQPFPSATRRRWAREPIAHMPRGPTRNFGHAQPAGDTVRLARGPRELDGARIYASRSFALERLAPPTTRAGRSVDLAPFG